MPHIAFLYLAEVIRYRRTWSCGMLSLETAHTVALYFLRVIDVTSSNAYLSLSAQMH